MAKQLIALNDTSFWKDLNTCDVCWYGPCMCLFVIHRQADGKGAYECEPAPPDVHEVPHDPGSHYRALSFIRQLRIETRMSRYRRGYDPDTLERLKDDDERSFEDFKDPKPPA